MDISILLGLQELRLALPDFVATLLALFSKVADGPGLVAICLIVYWCIDKRSGLIAMIAFAFSNFVSQLLKNTVCAYRPWIREAAIHPHEASIAGASGYSFPSGHTGGAMSSLGSLAWSARKKRMGITIALFAIVLIIAFSRLYLSVHTPQDVLVGFLIGLVFIALANLFVNWIERYDAVMPGHNKDVVVTVAVFVVCAASVAFVMLKPYPMDYVEGVLIVDPVTMQKGSFEAAGICMGFALSWLLERRLVGFSTTGIDLRTRGIRGVIGVLIVGITYVATDVVFKAVLPYNWAKLFALFFVVFMAVFVAPLVFNKVEQRKE